MKCTLLPLVLSWVGSSAENANPLGKVLSLMDDLTAKITKDAEVGAKAYHEYFEWCDDTAKNTQYATETGEREKAKLEASIGDLTSKIEVATSKIDELAGGVAEAQQELKNATVIREKEHSDFAASEGELMDAVETLGRAVGVLEKEMAKNPASFAQMDSKNMAGALQALSVVLAAASFNTMDQSKLTAFVQSQQANEADADELELGAPAAAAYKSQSNGIVDVLEDMKEKAEGQLSDLRKAEVTNRHNFKMLKQSLEDQSAADAKDLEDQKASKSSAEEAMATAEGDLEVTAKELTNSIEMLASTRSKCLQVAADHEATVSARKEELEVITKAKKILEETSSGASDKTYSFLQLHSKLAGSEVVAAVKKLAKKHHSGALAQLASRIATVMRFGGADPYVKVKGLIQDMIAKLEKEAGDATTEKAYCDEQMEKTEAKKSDLEDDIAKMTSKIDQSTAKSAQLKEEIQVLQGELALLTKEQAELDGIRQERHDVYVEDKSDLEFGLSGVRKALEVLREYYGGASASMLQDDAKFGAFMQQPAAPEQHSASSGAGGGIIDILEVVESDFATNLAKVETEEADSLSNYEKITQDNAVSKELKEKDVQYKTQESKSLDKTAAEFSADLETTNTELSAVLEYYAKIKGRCIAKPEKYSERKERREAEIEGLKQALSILEDETAFVQRKRRGGNFRGSLSAA